MITSKYLDEKRGEGAEAVLVGIGFGWDLSDTLISM